MQRKQASIEEGLRPLDGDSRAESRSTSSNDILVIGCNFGNCFLFVGGQQGAKVKATSICFSSPPSYITLESSVPYFGGFHLPTLAYPFISEYLLLRSRDQVRPMYYVCDTMLPTNGWPLTNNPNLYEQRRMNVHNLCCCCFFLFLALLANFISAATKAM